MVAGCKEGALHVWNWETSVEISHIKAHQENIHRCYLLPPTGMCAVTLTLTRKSPLYFDINISLFLFFKDKDKEVNPEEMTVVTTAEDSVVRLWKPLQVCRLK